MKKITWCVIYQIKVLLHILKKYMDVANVFMLTYSEWVGLKKVQKFTDVVQKWSLTTKAQSELYGVQTCAQCNVAQHFGVKFFLKWQYHNGFSHYLQLKY